VISVNAIGNSAASGTLSGVISANVPTVPLNLIRATTVTPVDTKITLDWDPSQSSGGSDILTYEIWWNGGTTAGTTPQDILTTTSSLITFYTVTGLTRGKIYMFKIRANNLVGPGPFTAIISLRAC
jgi:hypothetical protein